MPKINMPVPIRHNIASKDQKKIFTSCSLIHMVYFSYRVEARFYRWGCGRARLRCRRPSCECFATSRAGCWSAALSWWPSAFPPSNLGRFPQRRMTAVAAATLLPSVWPEEIKTNLMGQKMTNSFISGLEIQAWDFGNQTVGKMMKILKAASLF